MPPGSAPAILRRFTRAFHPNPPRDSDANTATDTDTQRDPDRHPGADAVSHATHHRGSDRDDHGLHPAAR